MQFINRIKRHAGSQSVLLLAGVLAAASVSAAPVTLTFTATVTSASNSFSGAGPTLSGMLVYDSVQGADLNGDPSQGLYSFSGSPYGFSVQVDNFGTLSNTSSLVQVGDDGAVLPGFDTVQFAGNDANNSSLQLNVDFSGATSSFTGDDIPLTSVISGMNPFLVIRESGSPDLQAVVTSASFSAVPVPPAVWLFGSALGLLAGLRKRLKAQFGVKPVIVRR
jgi:hypothetical protein